MKPFPFKLKFIALPLVYAAAATSIIYLALYTLLVEVLHIVSIKEEPLHIWFPIIIAIIVALVKLWPRIKLLALQGKKNPDVLVLMLAAAIIAVPIIIGTNYISKAIHPLITVTKPEEVNSKPYDKYFVIQNYIIDQSQAALEADAHVSGRHNETLNFSAYFVAPVFNKGGADSSAQAFFGKKYTSSISNHSETDVKEQAYKDFLQQSEAQFYDELKQPFTYLEKTGNNSDLSFFLTAAHNSTAIKLRDVIAILQPSYEPFADRTGQLLPWFFFSMLIGLAVWLLLVSAIRLNDANVQKFVATGKKSTNLLHSLLGKKPGQKVPVVTTGIIAINVIIFFIMFLQSGDPMYFSSQQLISWGANYGPLTLHGQWWRIITCQFLHAGAIHMIMNMVILYLIGNITEPVAGAKRFACIYLIGGTCASVASLCFHANVFSIGASGAVMAISGLLLAYVIQNVFPAVLKKSYLYILAGTGGVSLVYGFLTPQVDNAAHIGGAIAGFICGLLTASAIKENIEIQETEATTTAPAQEETI